MSREQRILVWLVVLVGFGFLIDILSDVLLPFVVGIIIAYLFDPLADRMQRMGLSRTLATSVILLGFFLLSAGILILLFPALQRQISAAIKMTPDIVESLRHFMGPVLTRLQSDLSPGMVDDLKTAVGEYAGTAVKWVSGLVGKVLSGGLAVLNLLSLLLITPLVAFYLLRDWDDIVAKIDGWLPRDAAPTIRDQVKKIDETLAGFLRGQGLVCATLAVFYAVGLTLAGLKAGLLIGLAAGALIIIPYIGATVSLLIGLGMAIAQFQQDWVHIAFVTGVFMLGQVLESYFLTPRLVGDRVGLSPVWIIFAMLAGGALFGLTGVLIAVPVAAVSGVLVRFGIDTYLQSDLYHGHGHNARANKDDGSGTP